MQYVSRTPYLLAGIAAAVCILTGCSSPRPTSGQADTETLYQVALQALTLGDYTGSITVEQLKQFGDTGLGTFDGLDSEMIVLDGVVYQALSDGTIATPDDDMTVPFSNVTFFEEDDSFSLSDRVTLDELKQVLDLAVDLSEAIQQVETNA